MTVDKRKWFDVPDSLTEREDGEASYYNVQARFSDHPVLHPEKTRIARSNVYEIGTILHTKVLRAGGDAPARKNMSQQVMHFGFGYKGEIFSEEDFKATKASIVRCWDAWQHYQTFREAPVREGEKLALGQINTSPEKPKGVLVDIGGKLERREFDVDADVDEERIEAEERMARAKMIPKPKRSKGRIEKVA
jgi:hypothetical protein